MMETNNIKVSTIKSISPNGSWSNGQQSFNKYTVVMTNGDAPDFSAIGNFKRKVGDTVYYTLDEKKNYAKLQQTPPNAKVEQSSTEQSGMTQQESIARSVGWNNVAAIVCSPEFQKHNNPDGIQKNSDGVITSKIFTDRQELIINQCASAANIIFRELITKPK